MERKEDYSLYSLPRIAESAGKFRRILDKYEIDAFRDLFPFVGKALSLEGGYSSPYSDWLRITIDSSKRQYTFAYSILNERKHVPAMAARTEGDNMTLYILNRKEIEGYYSAVPFELTRDIGDRIRQKKSFPRSISFLKQELDFLESLTAR